MALAPIVDLIIDVPLSGFPGPSGPCIRAHDGMALSLPSSKLQRRGLGAVEPGGDRRLQVSEHRSSLLGARCYRRPDPLTPAVPRFTPRSLRDLTVDHHESDRLF